MLRHLREGAFSGTECPLSGRLLKPSSRSRPPGTRQQTLFEKLPVRGARCRRKRAGAAVPFPAARTSPAFFRSDDSFPQVLQKNGNPTRQRRFSRFPDTSPCRRPDGSPVTKSPDRKTTVASTTSAPGDDTVPLPASRILHGAARPFCRKNGPAEKTPLPFPQSLSLRGCLESIRLPSGNSGKSPAGPPATYRNPRSPGLPRARRQDGPDGRPPACAHGFPAEYGRPSLRCAPEFW